MIVDVIFLSGKELRQSADRRKKAAYGEELKRQMQEMIALKQRSAYNDLVIESHWKHNMYILLSWVYVVIIITTYFCEILWHMVGWLLAADG